MAQLQSQFNANAIDPTQGGSFHQLPPGKHPVIITGSEVKATADKESGMVVFELQCIGGAAQGQTGTLMLNLYNKSDKAREIAEKQLSALCHAVGVFLLQNTEQLHNIPFGVEVTTRPLTPEQIQKQQAGETVAPYTQVNKILDSNGNEPKASGQQQQQAPAPQQQQAAQQPAGNGGWGGGQQQPAQQAAAPAPAAGGWGGQQQQPAAQAPAPANNGGGWQQGAAQAGGASWGR